jgi:hypothetical protein
MFADLPRDIDIVVPLVLLDSGDIEEKLHFALLLSLRSRKANVTIGANDVPPNGTPLATCASM